MLRLKSKGIYIDTSCWDVSVVLVWLYKVEVGTKTLGKSVMTVKLKLSSDNRVLTPAVHIEGSLSKDEGAGIRDGGSTVITAGGLGIEGKVTGSGLIPKIGRAHV